MTIKFLVHRWLFNPMTSCVANITHFHVLLTHLKLQANSRVWRLRSSYSVTCPATLWTFMYRAPSLWASPLFHFLSTTRARARALLSALPVFWPSLPWPEVLLNFDQHWSRHKLPEENLKLNVCLST